MRRTSEGYRRYAAEMQMMADVMHDAHKDSSALIYAQCAAEYVWIANCLDQIEDQRRVMHEGFRVAV